MSTVCGTPSYLAPEIIANEKYGPACDCWSLGVILYVLLCGYPPFDDDNNAQLVANVKLGKFDFPSPEWDDISEDAMDLIKRLLVPDPKMRLKTSDIAKHPWMTKYNSENEIEGFGGRLKKYNTKRKLKKTVLAVKAANRIMKGVGAMGGMMKK